MADDKETKRYLELQLEELKETYGTSEEEKSSAPKENARQRDKNAEIAKMYEDAAEYEADLEGFEKELEIVNANKLEDIAAALITAFPEEERDYAEELRTILETGWAHYIDAEQTHPKEQLDIIKKTSFGNVVKILQDAYPEYKGDFEKDVRSLLVKRWENLIAIKKEHIKQELAEIKTTGLKPKYVKRVYEQFHGIAKK